MGVVTELIGVGADLETETLLRAYRSGLFPMPLPDDLTVECSDVPPIGWWSPDPRGVLPLDGLRVSRSLRRSCRRFAVTVDAAFAEVVQRCADPQREHGWIDESIIDAYTRLHREGHAHSVEVWNAENGQLAGGLYGVSIGAFFAGESMFHSVNDASKVALVALVNILRQHHFRLLDVQWCTEHLASLGAVEIPRQEYLEALEVALSSGAEPLRPVVEPWRL